MEPKTYGKYWFRSLPPEQQRSILLRERDLTPFATQCINSIYNDLLDALEREETALDEVDEAFEF